MSYGERDLAISMMDGARLRKKGFVTWGDLENMMPWEVASQIEMFIHLHEEEKRQ